MKAADLLSSRTFTGHSIVELFGQRISFREMAKIIGAKIGMPHLSYVQFTERDALAGMVAMGVSQNVAESFVEMAKGINNGKMTPLVADADNPPAPTGFADFVDEVFYPAFNRS
jgi:hypothetical protein